MDQQVIGHFQADQLQPFRREPTPRAAQFLAAVKRRRWVIATVITIAVLLGILAVVMIKPSYTATSTIEIKREANDVPGIEDARAAMPIVDQEFYQTQYGLLRSHAIAERVATTLQLASDPAFYALFGDSRAEDWFIGGRLATTAPPLGTRLRRAGDILLDHIDVGSERSSRLVKISITSRSPEMSQRVVNAWGDAFIQDTLARRYDATTSARRFLEARLSQLRKRIDHSERQVVDYAERQGIINLPGAPASPDGSVSGERSLAADDLGTLNRVLGIATTERMAAQSRLQSPIGEVQEALDDATLSNLRQQRESSNADYMKLMAQFTPDYPAAKALRSHVAQLDKAIAEEEQRVKGTLRSNFEAATRRETSLKSRVDQLKSELLDVRRRSIQYNIYQREVDTNRQLYDALLQRYKAIGVGAGVGINNISVVDTAALPERPSSPNIPRILGLSLLLGILLAAGFAWALEQMNQGINDPGDVEPEIGVALLGAIPKLADMSPDSVFDRKSVVAESYLSLKSALSFTTAHGVPQTLAVTSAQPNEGKSTTSFALAVTLTYANKRVVLIDADMRSPSLHKYFGVTNNIGLSNFLSGAVDAAGVTQTTARAGLSLITAGQIPPSAPDLLSSHRIELLISELTKSYDYVIFDAPPVMGFADSPILGSYVEGVLFVVEAHKTKRSAAVDAVGRLFNAKVNVIGAVLTKFDTKRGGYGYGHDYSYDYGKTAIAA